jgi:HK97 family phage portal protein
MNKGRLNGGVRGLFDSIFGWNRPKAIQKELEGFFKTLTAYAPAFTTWGGALYESELIRACIDAIARHAGKMSLDIQGTANPKLRVRLRSGPNEWQTMYQFIYRLVTIMEMQNNAFIVPVLEYNAKGDLEIRGYFPILPSKTEILDVDGEPWMKYSFRNGETGYIEMERVGILTKFQYEDDIFGDDNRALNSTMELISMQKQGITEGIKNGATFRFMAQISNFTSPKDLAKERERFNRENLQGESGGLLLWPYEYKDPKQIEQKPYVVDADQMKLIQENVFNYLGVNSDVLQNKAVGDSWAAFYDGKLEPIAVQIGEAMTRMTFSRREIAQGNMVTVSANRLQYASTKEKLDVSSQMADRGIMNRNEIREIWGLPPIEGGDMFLVRGEYKDPDKEGVTVTEETEETTETIIETEEEDNAEE